MHIALGRACMFPLVHVRQARAQRARSRGGADFRLHACCVRVTAAMLLVCGMRPSVLPALVACALVSQPSCICLHAYDQHRLAAGCTPSALTHRATQHDSRPAVQHPTHARGASCTRLTSRGFPAAALHVPQNPTGCGFAMPPLPCSIAISAFCLSPFRRLLLGSMHTCVR